MLFLINKITLILIIVISVTLILALVFILFKMTHKERKVKIDDNFMTTMLNSLGGIDNIKSYSVENARVKFELVNVSLANLDALKELSTKGVFVSNNSVKTLFKYESSDIVKNLSKIKK